MIEATTPGAKATAVAAAEDPSRAPDVRMILDKASGPGWEMVVRYGVGTESEGREVRRRLRGRAHAVASAFGLFTGRNRLARRWLRRPERALVSRRLGRADLVSVDELAALAHLPTDRSIPELVRAGAAPVPPPNTIPLKGKVLGDSDAGRRRPVGLDPADAAYHLHVMGATGSGKSTLLTNLVIGDVASERGAAVIDPKGDLVVDILDRIPDEAITRVVLIDPRDPSPPSMNVLAGEDVELAVDHLVGIFHNIFRAHWGPRTDDVLRAACLTLLSDRKNSTIADIPLLLADGKFRSKTISGLKDSDSLSGFWQWYDALSEAQQAQVVGPVMNKLRAFLMREFVRKVVGQTESSFDMGKHVLDGGLLLVRIPKGIVGDETSKLLGSLVVARVWQAAIARARSGLGDRKYCALYIDECHNFLNLPRSFDEMLAEARGYRLSLVLAHQHLAQLPGELREGISANARNKIYFNMSPEDARVLQRHTGPVLDEHALSHLGGYQAAARLVAAGVDAAAFTLRTRPVAPPIEGRADEVRVRSSETFGAKARRSAAAEARRRALDPSLKALDGPADPQSTEQPVDHSTDQPGDQP